MPKHPNSISQKILHLGRIYNIAESSSQRTRTSEVFFSFVSFPALYFYLSFINYLLPFKTNSFNP